MDGLRRHVLGRLLVLAGVMAGTWGAYAELADVRLKNGLTLRGDVTVEDDEVRLQNAAGEVRIPRSTIEQITPVPEAGAAPAAPPTPVPAAAPVEEEPEEVEVPATREGGGGELAPAPTISKADIQRVRIHEIALDGAADPVQVRFERKGKQRDLVLEIAEELRRRPDYQPRWDDVLSRGQPGEKLQLILRETGLKYADRIRVLTDPEPLGQFRRQVLPLVGKSCARAGCHAGSQARLFRFPLGSKTSEAYAYSSFVLLDQMQNRDGRKVIDRNNPADSLLITYMLPQEHSGLSHPEVTRGPALKPVIWGREDPQYAALIEWINSLGMPHPDYELEYQNPYAGRIEGRAPIPEAKPVDRPTRKLDDGSSGAAPKEGPGRRPPTRPDVEPVEEPIPDAVQEPSGTP